MDRGQLRHRDEGVGLVRALLQLVDRVERTLHRGRVQIVHQHNVAVACLLNDDLLDVRRVAVFPILGVHAPVDDRQARLLRDRLDGVVDAAADRTQHLRRLARDCLDRLGRVVDLAADTVLIQTGTLHSGEAIIAGTAVGRVRTMRSDKGKLLNDAGPSTPVEITGLTAVPEAGDLFEAVADERLARELAEQRIAAAKEKQFSAFQKVTLDNLFSQMAQNDMKELAIVVKADVQGSAEAVKQSLEKISNDEVRVRVIHAGVGAISKSDVDLADASNAIIIGFNVRPDNVAKEEAAATKVEMRMYRVIYDAINDVTDAMKGMLAPKFREVSLGELQVRQVYKISNVGTVAGCRVTSGKITRDSKVRVVRDGIVITEDEIASLKRFKDDAKEVAEGYECGVTLAKFADVKEGDVYEAFKMEEYRD